MKRLTCLSVLSLILVLLLAAPAVMGASLDIITPEGDESELSSGRTVSDYKSALVELVDADSAGEIILAEDNNITYPFVPLKKDDEIIGYGSWVNTVIYQHAEDLIAVVSPEGLIRKWKPIDANKYHPELQKEQFLSRYYGMSLKTNFDPEVDVISGSTYSSNVFFFELRNILLTYDQYGPGAKENN